MSVPGISVRAGTLIKADRKGERVADMVKSLLNLAEDSAGKLKEAGKCGALQVIQDAAVRDLPD